MLENFSGNRDEKHSINSHRKYASYGTNKRLALICNSWEKDLWCGRKFKDNADAERTPVIPGILRSEDPPSVIPSFLGIFTTSSTDGTRLVQNTRREILPSRNVRFYVRRLCFAWCGEFWMKRFNLFRLFALKGVCKGWPMDGVRLFGRRNSPIYVIQIPIGVRQVSLLQEGNFSIRFNVQRISSIGVYNVFLTRNDVLNTSRGMFWFEHIVPARWVMWHHGWY